MYEAIGAFQPNTHSTFSNTQSMNSARSPPTVMSVSGSNGYGASGEVASSSLSTGIAGLDRSRGFSGRRYRAGSGQ